MSSEEGEVEEVHVGGCLRWFLVDQSGDGVERRGKIRLLKISGNNFIITSSSL